MKTKMISPRSLIQATLCAAAFATPSLASYTGPDGLEYDYKIITWSNLQVYDQRVEWVTSGQLTDILDTFNLFDIQGTVVLGPGGVEDFSVSEDEHVMYTEYSFPDQEVEMDSWSWRSFTAYRPNATTTLQRDYSFSTGTGSIEEPTISVSAPSVSAGGLDVSYPTSITGGTITASGPGYITQTGPEPAEFESSPSYYLEYYDASHYVLVAYETAGVQERATITWTNTAPAALEDPAGPFWTDPEFDSP